MKIFVFNRNGHEWSDFRMPEDSSLVRSIDCSTHKAINKHMKRESGRVLALLERAKIETPPDVKQSLGAHLLPFFKWWH